MRNSDDDRNVYTPLQIGVTSIFGGVLAGAWMMANNYKAFSEQRSATKAMVLGVFGTIVAIMIALFLPDRIPLTGVIAGISIGMYQAALSMQGKQIKVSLKEKKLDKMPIWMCLLVGLVSVAASLIFVFVAVIVLTMFGIITIAP